MFWFGSGIRIRISPDGVKKISVANNSRGQRLLLLPTQCLLLAQQFYALGLGGFRLARPLKTRGNSPVEKLITHGLDQISQLLFGVRNFAIFRNDFSDEITHFEIGRASCRER